MSAPQLPATLTALAELLAAMAVAEGLEGMVSVTAFNGKPSHVYVSTGDTIADGDTWFYEPDGTWSLHGEAL